MWYNKIQGISKNPFLEKTAKHDICCVNLPWSAKARLWKLSLQLPHLSVFPLTKRVLRDALKYSKEIFDLLSDKDKNLLWHSYGAFGYEEMTIKDIATLEMMAENGVKKQRRRLQNTSGNYFLEAISASGLMLFIGLDCRLIIRIGNVEFCK